MHFFILNFNGPFLGQIIYNHKHLNVTSVAAAIQIDRKNLNRILSNQTTPSIATINKIIAYVPMTTADILQVLFSLEQSVAILLGEMIDAFLANQRKGPSNG